MNCGAKDRRREHPARDRLTREGYAVTRAAGSLGAWDLAGIRRSSTPDSYLPVVRLIQVKSNRWPGREEWAALERDAMTFMRPFVACECWRYDDGDGTPRLRMIGADVPDDST